MREKVPDDTRNSPFVLKNAWAGGWTIVAIPKNDTRILSYAQLKNEVRSCYPSPSHSLPFITGWVGFLSYDLGANFLGIRSHAKKNTRCPEVYFAYCNRAYLKDPKGKWWYVGNSHVRRIASPPDDYCNVISGLRPAGIYDRSENRFLIKPEMTYEEYTKKISAIKEYLYSGETYQVNFSQRFSLLWHGKPAQLFQRISTLNPSPYEFFCEDKKFAVVSNSPELLVRGWREGETFRVQTRPIKGTIARGKNAQEDARNIKKLLSSEKEKAELAMIVDLERNDLGKVCRPGSVRVIEPRAVEKYSHVIHTVSTIEGNLGEDSDVFNIIEAMFPGGSVTGCPKKRTVEIIDKLEDFRRGIYCGSAGYISQCGNFEFNIMIRTLWYENKERIGRVIFNSGGGIVVDSDAKLEYEETLHKSKALWAGVSGA